VECDVPVARARSVKKSRTDDDQFRLFDANLRPTFCFQEPKGFPLISYPRLDRGDGRPAQIFVASRTRHAAKWRSLREAGWPIISTWIDEAGPEESRSLRNLALRCIQEAASCSYFILYCEVGDQLKGALLECGAALANSIPVYSVGTCQSISRIFEHHPCWHSCVSIDEALEQIEYSAEILRDVT